MCTLRDSRYQQVIRSLRATQETWTEFLAPRHLGGKLADRHACMHFVLCLSNKQNNKKKIRTWQSYSLTPTLTDACFSRESSYDRKLLSWENTQTSRKGKTHKLGSTNGRSCRELECPRGAAMSYSRARCPSTDGCTHLRKCHSATVRNGYKWIQSAKQIHAIPKDKDHAFPNLW